MAGAAGPLVEACTPQHRLAIAAAVQVNRKNHRRTAGTLRARDHLLGPSPVALMVELEPHRGAARRDGILNGSRGDGGEHLQVVLCPGRTSDRDFTLWMEGLLAAHGIDDDRRGIAGPEQRHAPVDRVHIHQAPRPQRPAGEAFAVGPDGAVVIGPGGEIGPVRHRNLGAGHRLEIKDIQRLGRGANGRGTLQGLLGQGEGFRRTARRGPGQIAEQPGAEARRREERTSGEKVEELTAIGHGDTSAAGEDGTIRHGLRRHPAFVAPGLGSRPQTEGTQPTQ
jgi:hypothetical protein